MASPPKSQQSSSGDQGGQFTSPKEYAQTFPPGFTASDHSWILQTTMEMQKSLGQLTEKIDALRGDVSEQRDKIHNVEKILYAASVVLLIALAVGGFLLNKLWDPLMHMLVTYAKTH